jgi:hypothetical protein
MVYCYCDHINEDGMEEERSRSERDSKSLQTFGRKIWRKDVFWETLIHVYRVKRIG